MEIIAKAAGLFTVTNIDDIVLLAVFFAQGARTWRVVAGQYLGFLALLAISVAVAFGATFLPPAYLPWLGLLPIALGVKAALSRGDGEEPTPVGVLGVAAVTFANGGDNIGVYVPVFATEGPLGIALYSAVFLVLVAVWCALGRFFATRQVVAKALSHWGHVVVPVVLIGIGLLILFG